MYILYNTQKLLILFYQNGNNFHYRSMVLQKHPPASNVESPILLDDIFIIAHQVTCHKRFQLNTTPQKG